MDLRLKELQDLCQEIALHYTSARDMQEYGKLAIALIGRQDTKERCEKKLKSLETVLKDKEIPQKIVNRAYEAYEILTSYLDIEKKQITDFREEPLKQYSFEELLKEQAKEEKSEPKKEIVEKQTSQVVEEVKIKDTYAQVKGESLNIAELLKEEPIEEPKQEDLKDIVELLKTEEIPPKPEITPKPEPPTPKPEIEVVQHYEKPKPSKPVRPAPETKKEVKKEIKVEKKVPEKAYVKQDRREKKRDGKEKNLRGLAIPMAIGGVSIITTAAIFGNLYNKIRSIEKDNEEKQKFCQNIIEKKEIKNLIDRLNGQTLYANDLSSIINEEIKPGKYNLSDLFSCLGHCFEDEINAYLDSAEIKVKERGKIFNNPLDGLVIKKCYFGQTGRILGGIVSDRPHGGDDLCGLTNDTIYAAADGVIYEVDTKYTPGVGYGKKIVIQHDGNLKTLYAHCSEIYVNEDDSVKMGDKIGKEGKTGYAFGEHLHLEVRKGAVRVNPAHYYERTISAKQVKENNSNAYLIYKTLNNKDE